MRLCKVTRISVCKSLFPLGNRQHCPCLFLPELPWYKVRKRVCCGGRALPGPAPADGAREEDEPGLLRAASEPLGSHHFCPSAPPWQRPEVHVTISAQWAVSWCPENKAAGFPQSVFHFSVTSFEALVRNVLCCICCRAAQSGYFLISQSARLSAENWVRVLAVVHRCVDALLAVPFIRADVCVELPGSPTASSVACSAALLHPGRLGLEAKVTRPRPGLRAHHLM